MEFLIIITAVLACWVWYLKSTRHDGSVKCPRCKAVNAGTWAPCWKCQYEFETRSEERGKLNTCSTCGGQYYASPDWEHHQCYKCYATAHVDK